MDSFAFLVALDDLDKFSFDGHVGETVGPIVNYNGSRLLLMCPPAPHPGATIVSKTNPQIWVPQLALRFQS